MMRYAGGVDVGSTQTKAVVIDEERRIVGHALIMTGANVVAAAQEAFQAALDDAVVREADVGYVIGTGYGRYRVSFGNDQVTEISCHARGAAHLFPGTRTVLDMGGQDTKAIKIGPNGDVIDFCMNDKCAAGTGRFLQAASFALDIPLGSLGTIALGSSRPVTISTTCTVFAESEVLSWAAKGKKVEDILMGVHRSIAARSVALLRRVGVEQAVTFTGGVARNPAMVAVLNELLDLELQVGEDAHYMGALGAALYGMDRIAAGAVATPAGASAAGAAQGVTQ
jgi:predicted CoA-substrate-specific enzyme activase